MPSCDYPLHAYRLPRGGGITFNRKQGITLTPLTLPCGRCMGCKLEKARQWAVRMSHECETSTILYKGQRRPANIFITLTYNRLHCPADDSLNPKHWDWFAKRFRRECGPFRYYQCGEYGKPSPENDNIPRPHMHAIIFGHDFSSDRKFLRSENGNKFYTSKTLQKIWPYGYHDFSDATFEAARYVAGYITEKITGDLAEEKYKRLDLDGTEYQVLPEYATMSRMPGLGKKWIDRYMYDVYPRDVITLNGHPSRPPKFYDSQLEKINPEMLETVIHNRKIHAIPYQSEQNYWRRDARRITRTARTRSQSRDLV